MLTGMVLLVFAIGQEQTDGGPPPPPPCDPNSNYPVADPGPDGGCGNYNDCNGNGAYDLGEPCGDPVPFEDVDENGDGVVDREEGRAQYGYDPNFDQAFDEADTNGDGVVDHPEYDAAVQAAVGQGPGEGDGESDPVWEAFSSTLANGGSPDDAFEAAAAAVYDLNVDREDFSEEEFQEGKAKAREAYDQALADGKSPEEAFGDAMAAAGPPAPTNHWDGNCAAIMNGQDEYWLDSDGDGAPEDGPYAVWYEDADGNPVNCGPGPGNPGSPPTCEEMDMNGDGVIDREEARDKFGDDPNFDQRYDEVDTNDDGVVDCGEHDIAVAQGPDGPGDGDTYWADEAYQLQGQQEHYDRVMGVAEEDREHEYKMIKDELGIDDGDSHDGPPPFEEIDTNGDGVVDREEARDKFGDDPNFDQRFDEVDTNDDGVVDHAEHMAAAGDGGDMTPADHIFMGLEGFLNDMIANGIINEDDKNFLIGAAENLEEKTHAEYSDQGCEGCAGEALDGTRQWLDANVPDEGFKQHYLRELCILEYEIHAEYGPMDGPPQCD